MKRKAVVNIMIFTLFFFSCRDVQLSSFDNDKINEILSQFDENDPVFVQKEVSFDSIVTYTGIRVLNGVKENVKVKLFFFGNNCRGYFNLRDTDDKNLQIFGRKLDNLWAIKCVTKLNMEEVGGYMIMENSEGIWSNGHVNFNKGKIALEKSLTDYSQLNFD